MNLSKVLQAAYFDLGMAESFVATGGSATTVINTEIAQLEEQPDDDYAIDYTIFIVRDAGGASASPEGKFGRVSDYVASTQTYTIATVSDAVAVGDECMLCTNDIPLREMIRAANRGLQEIGIVSAVPNTSLTSAASQTEYTLPAVIQKGEITGIFYQGITTDANDNQWIPIHDWRVEQGTYGSTGNLIIPQITASRTIKVVYNGIHADLTAWNSEIAETIPDRLAIAATVKQALRWYVNNNEGGEEFWKQRYNEAALDFETYLPKLKKKLKPIMSFRHWQDTTEDEFTYPQTE